MAYVLSMDRKPLTLRLDEDLYDALSALSGAVRRSRNALICEAVTRYVATESETVAQDLESTLAKLKSYRTTDPGFDRAIEAFAEAEGAVEDPLEGEPHLEDAPIRSRLRSLLSDG